MMLGCGSMSVITGWFRGNYKRLLRGLSNLDEEFQEI
jgi:hypothetical protein